MILSRLSCLLLASVCLPVTRAVRIHPTLDNRQRQTETSNSSGSTGKEQTERVTYTIPTDPAQHSVQTLPLLDPEDFSHPHWAGHLPASADGHKHLFYWLFAPDLEAAAAHLDVEIPLIIWLNGGPGCSSLDGNFLENGPFKFEKQGGQYHLKANEHSWHKTPAFVLYIDQPVGTGLSFTTGNKYASTDEEVNQDFYYFLQSFFTLHFEKFGGHDVGNHNMVRRHIYFSGESHAGHYIPSMMNYILQQNNIIQRGETTTKNKDKIIIALAGAAIGNGWTDPVHQYAAAEAAYGHGIIGRAQVAALKIKEDECQARLRKGEFSVSVCYNLLDDIVRQSQGSGSEYKVSQYDVRKTEPAHGARTFPPGHKVVEAYLGGWDLDEGGIPPGIMKEVLEALHATAATTAGQTYQECTDPPYDALAHQDGKGVVGDLVQVLEHGSNIKVLFFNGIEDLICNHVGNEKFLEVLPWSNRDKWVEAERYAWKANSEEKGKISGYMKEYENLLFLKLLNSGHMVPLDIPNIALDMMRVLVFGLSFDTNKQLLARAKTEDPSCAVCPTCDNTSPTDASSNESSTVGAFVISYAWLVAFVAAVAFVAVATFFRQRRAISHADVSYDLELREGQYTDEPDDDETHEVL